MMGVHLIFLALTQGIILDINLKTLETGVSSDERILTPFFGLAENGKVIWDQTLCSSDNLTVEGGLNVYSYRQYKAQKDGLEFFDFSSLEDLYAKAPPALRDSRPLSKVSLNFPRLARVPISYVLTAKERCTRLLYEFVMPSSEIVIISLDMKKELVQKLTGPGSLTLLNTPENGKHLTQITADAPEMLRLIIVVYLLMFAFILVNLYPRRKLPWFFAEPYFLVTYLVNLLKLVLEWQHYTHFKETGLITWRYHLYLVGLHSWEIQKTVGLLLVAFGFRIARSSLNLVEVRTILLTSSIYLLFATMSRWLPFEQAGSSTLVYTAIQQSVYGVQILGIVVGTQINLAIIQMRLQNTTIKANDVGKLYHLRQLYYEFRRVTVFDVLIKSLVLAFIEQTVCSPGYACSSTVFLAEFMELICVTGYICVFRPRRVPSLFAKLRSDDGPPPAYEPSDSES